jgi:hypothetical protein
MAGGPNLLLRLHKWAIRQDENFVTEAFACLLEQLLLLAPEVGTRLISKLTAGSIRVAGDGASSIAIQAQVETGEGRPDLEVRVPHWLVWIEVKVESPLRAGQLEGYRVLLRRAGVANTRLILLTRYPEQFFDEDTRPDFAIRWFEVADWIETELPALAACGDIANFVAAQFLDFLRARGMTLTQVGKYMPDGLRALGSLLNMLTEAALACKVPVIKKPSADVDNIGLRLDGGKYWTGLYYAEPEKLWFCTRCKIDRDAAARLPGEITEPSWCPTGVWWNGIELDSESVHFYSLSKVQQIECLETFLRDCLAKARSIETGDQPPIPDESEGS